MLVNTSDGYTYMGQGDSAAMLYSYLYSVHLSIGGKGRCRIRHDLQDHHMQGRKCAGERSTLDLKPMRKDTGSPKQEQSVALQNGPSSNKFFF